eukprot:scaffold72199_cov33-Prasinocladus_malaysianus.AAC.2
MTGSVGSDRAVKSAHFAPVCDAKTRDACECPEFFAARPHFLSRSRSLNEDESRRLALGSLNVRNFALHDEVDAGDYPIASVTLPGIV